VVVVAATTVMGAVVIPSLTKDELTPAEVAASYEQHCGTCHGLRGEGQLGPQIGGGAVADAFPDIDDQIAVITEGRGGMPPFGQSLSDAEIRAIAEYTREELGR
jgi:mono/diheme cytochrome c family protein